ncbi:DUF6298 domain-containing protein [Gemmatimonadota bacterium]
MANVKSMVLMGLFILLWTSNLSPLSAAQAPGPLEIHPTNPRYFTADGRRAVYLTGSHTWANFQERGLEGETPDFDYERYLDFIEEYGHNFLRLWTWEHAQWMQFVPPNTLIRYKPLAYQRTGPGEAIDGKPKFDLSRFNQAYFNRLRQRVIEAGQRGIYVSVMMFQGFSVEQKGSKGVDSSKGNAWQGHPFNSANNINGINGDANSDGEGQEVHTMQIPSVLRQQKAYIKKVVDTLNDLDNVIWEISNESHAGSIEWQYNTIRFIQEYEATKPYQHLIGMTGAPIIDQPLFASPSDWISPVGKEYINNPPDMAGKKIIIVDNDHIRPWESNPDWVWKNFMRGNHFILMDSYMDFRMGSPDQPEPQHSQTRLAMGYARELAENDDLASMVPDTTVSSSRYCLANPGIEYLIYIPNSENGQLTLIVKSGIYSVEWINCVTNERRPAEDIVVEDGYIEFKSPFRFASVLHLNKNE